MGKFKLSNAAKEDLIRIHHYGVKKFGKKQADKYFNSFFDNFELIAERPHSFEAVDFIKPAHFPVQLELRIDWSKSFMVHKQASEHLEKLDRNSILVKTKKRNGSS